MRAPAPADADTLGAWRLKQREPGWRAIGRLAVKAASASRRQQLATNVMAALRSAEAPGVRLTGRTTSSSKLDRLNGHGKLRLNVSELTAIVGWPLGDTAHLPVVRLGSRRLPVPATVPTHGRVLGQSTWPGIARQLAISASDSLRHLHLLGPTGTGKSTLVLNLILQDTSAGRGVVVIDPKGDLVSDVLARLDDKRRDDVVVIDPSSTERPVGLNPLAAGSGEGRSAELVADHLLEVFHRLYAANWGPRTNDILGASLLTLARVGGMSLVAVALLLTDPAFRRRIVGQLDDPVGLEPFWASFEAWSEAERTTAIAPVLNKLRPFLMRSGIRRIVGQVSPRFDVREVFTKRRIVLVDLAKGKIGSEAAALLGALLLSQVWQASQQRSSVPAARRHPVNVYLDEFQDYLALPTNLADALAQARGLGVGFTLAHQHLGQLPTSIREAVLANARSRVCFQLAADDARVMAGRSPLLASEDFQSLDAFHFYAQLVAEGQVQPWCSGVSQAPSLPVRDQSLLRAHAAERFGTPADEVDAGLIQLAAGGRRSDASSSRSAGSPDDLAPRRRTSGGAP